MLQAVECVLGQHTVVTDAFDLEQFPVDTLAEVAEMGEIVDTLPDVEVLGVVDGGLGAEGVLLLEVLFHMRGLVLDVETGFDSIGDHTGSLAIRRRRCGAGDPTGKQQAHAVGPAEVQIVADDRLEEVAALHRTVEGLGETGFELVDGEAMRVAGGPVDGGERPRQALRPPVEERLHVGGRELVTPGLQAGGLRTRQEAVVQTLERQVRAAQLLLHPLVTVQTDLHGIREIGADLQEGRSPLLVLDVEVVVIHGHRLARKIKRDRRAKSRMRLGGSHLLLRHAEHNDALTGGEPRAVRGDDVVFALAAFEMYDRHVVGRHEPIDRGDEPIVQGLEEGWGRYRVPEVVVQEVAQAA